IFGEHEGKPLPLDKFPKVELRFSDGEFEMLVPGQGRVTGTYTIDPLKGQIILRPKLEKAVPVPMSYLWRGDRLRLEVSSLTLSTPPAPTAPLYLEFEAASPPSKESPPPAGK